MRTYWWLLWNFCLVYWLVADLFSWFLSRCYLMDWVTKSSNGWSEDVLRRLQGSEAGILSRFGWHTLTLSWSSSLRVGLCSLKILAACPSGWSHAASSQATASRSRTVLLSDLAAFRLSAHFEQMTHQSMDLLTTFPVWMVLYCDSQSPQSGSHCLQCDCGFDSGRHWSYQECPSGWFHLAGQCIPVLLWFLEWNSPGFLLPSEPDQGFYPLTC